MIYNKHKDKFPFELGTAFPILTTFLTTTEKIKLATTCKLLRGLIFRPHIWACLQIKDTQNTSGQKLQTYLKWVNNQLDLLQPQKIIISMKEDEQMQKRIINVFLKPRQYVKQIAIRSKEPHLYIAISRSCINTEKIIFHSNLISDLLLESMMKSFSKINQLEINADALQFTAQNIQNYIKYPLQKLVLKPYQLNYSSLHSFLKNQKLNYIQELQIDVEQCDQYLLPMIIGQLRYINKLRLYHMQKFDNSILIAQNLNTKLTQLVLTKCYKLNMEPLIPKISTNQLESLDLTQAINLNDQQVLFLSNNAFNLKSINLSWCNELTNNSIQFIIQRCILLEKIVLNGIKSLTDDAFSEYVLLKQQFNEKQYQQIRYQFKKQFKEEACQNSEQFCSKFIQKNSFDRFFIDYKKQTKTLRNLKHLQCNSCNRVSDTILKIIYCFSRSKTCSIINYYGQDLSIINTNELFDYDFY